MRDRGSNRVLHGFSWSAAFMLTSRATAFVSVPLVLHGVGTRLYAVWVLAGSLVARVQTNANRFWAEFEHAFARASD